MLGRLFTSIGLAAVALCALPNRALADGSLTIPRLSAGTDSSARRAWASCQAVRRAQQHLAGGGLASAGALRFDAASWQAARERLVKEAPDQSDAAQLKTLLEPLAQQVAALAGACDAIFADATLSVDQLRSFEALSSHSSLEWLDAQTAALASGNADGRALATAFSEPLVAVPEVPPASEPAEPGPESAPPTLLDQAQQRLVREGLQALFDGACDAGKYRDFLEETCRTLEGLRVDGELATFHHRLHQAAARDASRLPESLLGRSVGLDDRTVTLWLFAVFLREGFSSGDWLGLVRGLSAVDCGGKLAPYCGQGTPRALRLLGELSQALEQQSRAFQQAPSDEQTRVLTLVVALRALPNAGLAEIEERRRLASKLMTGLQRVSEASPDLAAQAAVDYLVAYLDTASAPAVAQVQALQSCVVLARQGNFGKAAIEATGIARENGVALPQEISALLSALEAMKGDLTAQQVLDALANSPWIGKALAEKLRGRAPKRSFDPFGDAPRRRPDDTGKREGLARYLGGVRAGYVYQHWKPQDISDVAYSTSGLNLLRVELLLNSDEIPLLELLEGYFRYELAPGGSTEQDELVRLYEQEASGWQAILAELAADLPTFSSKNSLRGPAIGYQRRFFLASAQALKDYWYYDEAGVGLLAPGDTIRTNTAMTVYNLGFRSTQLRNDRPRWGWELGGYYLDYRKPYTHSRFTTIDRAAIFDATFEGIGAYGVGRLFLPSSNRDAPGQLSLNVKLGRADILLDDIAASELLPNDSSVFMLEATAELQFPVVWFGGFFLGGMGHLTYRNFGDYFSGGENDAARVNDQTLNDDFVLGVTAQAGYLL